MKTRAVYQDVTVEIGRFSDGLCALVRAAAGAPAKADVTFHEKGVTVTWRRRRRITV